MVMLTCTTCSRLLTASRERAVNLINRRETIQCGGHRAPSAWVAALRAPTKWLLSGDDRRFLRSILVGPGCALCAGSERTDRCEACGEEPKVA